MADKMTPMISKNKVVGYKGSQAGKSFASGAEVDEKKDWDDYKREKNLMFTATRTQHAADFAKWREGRAKKKGQSAALGKLSESKQ